MTDEPKIQKKKRFFQGVPVREARGEILVKPTASDIDGATPRDPENCVYAVCLKRMLATKRVFVYTHIAYIETLDENGNALMERYFIRNSAKHYIERVDAGKKVGPGGFILHRAPPSQTLDRKAQVSREFVRKNPEKTKIYQANRIKKMRKNPVARQLLNGEWRSGTGQVKFIGTYEGKINIRK
jgi:hypothetical protein